MFGPGTTREEDLVSCLITMITDVESSDGRRAAAVESLASFTPEMRRPALPLMLNLLEEKVNETGPFALGLCSAIDNARPKSPQVNRAFEVLRQSLESKSNLTRTVAAYALGQFCYNAESVLRQLRVLEEGDHVPPVQGAAKQASGLIKLGLVTP